MIYCLFYYLNLESAISSRTPDSILKPFSSHLGSAPRLMGYHGCLVQKPRHLTASELNCWGVEGEKRAFKQTNTSFVVKAIINFKILWSFHISKTNLDISNLKEWFFSIYLSIYVFIWAVPCGMQDPSSQPGIKPVPPALGGQSLNHWTREVPFSLLNVLFLTSIKFSYVCNYVLSCGY